MVKSWDQTKKIAEDEMVVLFQECKKITSKVGFTVNTNDFGMSEYIMETLRILTQRAMASEDGSPLSSEIKRRCNELDKALGHAKHIVLAQTLTLPIGTKKASELSESEYIDAALSAMCMAMQTEQVKRMDAEEKLEQLERHASESAMFPQIKIANLEGKNEVLSLMLDKLMSK